MVPPARADAARELSRPAALDARRGCARLRGLARSTRTSWSSRRTNSLDEREFYTFHQTSSLDRNGALAHPRPAHRRHVRRSRASTGIPAVTYGAWSPIYTSTNPAVDRRPDQARRHRARTSSRTAAPSSPAHKLMPGLPVDGQPDDRRHDRRALPRLRLHRQAVPEPRVHERGHRQPGVLAAPARPARAAGVGRRPWPSARSQYLRDGTEPAGVHVRRRLAVTTSESAGDATPTTSAPAEPGAATSPTTTLALRRRRPRRRRLVVAGADGGSSASQFLAGKRTGAPIDLWDTNWPSSGYYWTVVGVAAESPGAHHDDRRPGGRARRARPSPVTNGDRVQPRRPDHDRQRSDAGRDTSRPSAATRSRSPSASSSGTASGEPVVRTGGNFHYQDVELPQDVCAAGRVMRFGKESEPSLVASGELFASGLSSDGRLTSAVQHDRVLRAAARLVDAGARRRGLRGAVEQDAVPVQLAETAATGTPGIMTVVDVGRPPRRPWHVVVPRARLRLLAPDRRAADVVVRPGEARGREAEVQARRRYDVAELDAEGERPRP